MINYEVIEYKEIFLELYSGLIADFNRVIKKESEHQAQLLIMLREKVNIIRDDILSKKYSTMEDIAQLKGIYLFVKEYTEELNQYNPPKVDRSTAYPNSKTVRAMKDGNNKHNVVGPFDTVEDVMEAL